MRVQAIASSPPSLTTDSPLSRSITMALCHLFRLLACVTLLLDVRHVSAGSTCPIMQNTCPVLVQIEDGYELAHVALQETLEFDLNPNLPQMSMRFQQDDMVYKATVDGTMLRLSQCDERESNCTMLDEGGTKSRDLLMTNEWNKILVKYINGEITVDVNLRSNVMGRPMKMIKEPSKSGNGHVTFLVPPTTPIYSATLRIPCFDAPPQIWTQCPDSPIPTAATTIAPSQPESPYKECPLYQVEVNHPSIPALLGNNLTLAVYPNHSALRLIIGNDHLHFKVHIDGSSAELLQCKMVDRGCISMYNNSINEVFIVPGKWNFVTLSLLEDKIIMGINKRKAALIASLQSPYRKDFKVSAVAPRDTSIGAQEYFVAFVNVKCEVIEQKMVWPDTTQAGLPTKAPIVEATAKPATPGISRTVIIVVGVLIGILLIIALAIIISVMKKRHSATINEHSPLQNQQQKQDY